MIRQCTILFGCLALIELVVFLTGVRYLPYHRYAAYIFEVGLDEIALGSGCNVRFMVANLGFSLYRPEWPLMLYFGNYRL